MQTPDLSPLVKGVIARVGLALALGQYGRLERWARTQAMEALAWKEPLPYFFAPPHAASHAARPRTRRAHAPWPDRRPSCRPDRGSRMILDTPPGMEAVMPCSAAVLTMTGKLGLLDGLYIRPP